MDDTKIPRFLYHATDYKNLYSILKNGITKTFDGIYFADSYEGAAMFLYFRECKDIIVFEIDTELLNKVLIKESFDHSPGFFKGIFAYCYKENIDSELIDAHRIMHYDLRES